VTTTLYRRPKPLIEASILERVEQVSLSLGIGPDRAILLLILEALTEKVAPDLKTWYKDVTDAGETEVVERVNGKKIRVVGYTLNNGGSAVAVHFRSNSRPISSTKTLAANGGGMVVQVSQAFQFETAGGEALKLNLSVAGTVAVDVTYIEVPV